MPGIPVAVTAVPERKPYVHPFSRGENDRIAGKYQDECPYRSDYGRSAWAHGWETADGYMPPLEDA